MRCNIHFGMTATPENPSPSKQECPVQTCVFMQECVHYEYVCSHEQWVEPCSSIIVVDSNSYDREMRVIYGEAMRGVVSGITADKQQNKVSK